MIPVTLAILYALVVVGLLAAMLSATAARAMRDFSSHELQELCSSRKAGPDLFGHILHNYERVALAIENVRLIATAVAAGSAALSIWIRWGGEQPQVAGLLIESAIALIALLAGVIWVPHAVVALWAEVFLYRTWRVWFAVSRLVAPLVAVSDAIGAIIYRLTGRTPTEGTEESLEDELRSIVTEGHHEGLLENEAREMIEGIIDLNDAQVSEIMTPRTDVFSMPVDIAWDDAVQRVIEAGHTRIPVYGKSRDDIVGLLHAKDLLPELAKRDLTDRKSIADILRSPFFVPETKPVTALLQEFQLSRNHIAVVLDEFGGVSGVVTIEDVLEEIVGEIADEYDEDLIDGIKTIDENTAEALARVPIREVNQRLSLSLPEDADFDTIGGFVFHEMGRIPLVGEELVRPDVRIRVIDATRRRIDRLLIETVGKSQRIA